MKKIVAVLIVFIATMPSSLNTACLAQALPPVGTYDQELANATADGIDLNLSHQQAPLPPIDQNAAPIYYELSQLLASRSKNLESISPILDQSSKLTPEEFVQLKSIVTANADLLVLIHQAVARPQFVVLHDWTSSLTPTQIKEFEVSRSCERLLGAESLVKAFSGDAIGSVDNASLGFKLPQQSCADVPKLISDLVAMSIQNMTIHCLHVLLDYSNGDSAVAAEIAKVLTSNYVPVNLKLALHNEMAEIPGYSQRNSQGVATLLPGANSGQILAPLLSRWRLLSDIVDSPISEIHLLRDKVFQECDANQSTVAFEKPEMTSDFACIDKRAYIDAEIKCLRLGCDVIVFATKNKTYPGSLDLLQDTSITDPFSNKPLQYHLEDGGFTVFSVGSDGSYDGRPVTDKDTKAAVFHWPQP